MVTDAKVISGLLILAVVLFVAFWIIEGLPILG